MLGENDMQLIAIARRNGTLAATNPNLSESSIP